MSSMILKHGDLQKKPKLITGGYPPADKIDMEHPAFVDTAPWVPHVCFPYQTVHLPEAKPQCCSFAG